MNSHQTKKVSLFSERGAGLIEILVGMGLVVLLAGGSSYYSSLITANKQGGYETRYNCSAQLATVFSKIRGDIGITQVMTFHPNGTNRTPSSNSPNAFSYNDVVSDAELWNGVPAVMDDVPGSTPKIANGILLGTPIRVFNALYNSTSTDYCSALQSSSRIDTIAGLSKASLSTNNQVVTSSSTKIRLQLFNLNTGALLPCSTKPVWIYPTGISATDPNANAIKGNYVTVPANYRNDVGILVEAQTNYKEADASKNLVDKQCALSQRLYFERDTTRPALPTVTLTAASAPADGGNANQNTATVNINYTAGENGTVLLCRDRSTKIPPGPLACYSPGGNGSTGPGSQYDPPPVVGLPAVGSEPSGAVQYGASRPASWPASQWMPCERVPLCGVQPNSTNFTNVPGGSVNFANNYSGVSSECIARIEAVAVDTAGNLNELTGATFSPALISSTVITPISNTVTPRPTCGTKCTYAGQSYFQMGACCTGINCQAGQILNPTGAVLPQSTNN